MLTKKIRAIILLFLSYLFVLTISYSTFLQIPVFENQPLLWQSLVEQSITWIPITLTYLYLIKAVVFKTKIKKTVVNEKKLLIPGLLFLFLSALSIGAHGVAQIAEDFLVNNTTTEMYKTMYFFDEYVGHMFIVTITLLFFVIVLLELNRKPETLTNIQNKLLWGIALFNGFVWGIAGIEGGSIYIINIPITVIVLSYLTKIIRKQKFKLNDYILTKYFFISSSIMILFSIFWIFTFGLFSQPESSGLHLLTF